MFLARGHGLRDQEDCLPRRLLAAQVRHRHLHLRPPGGGRRRLAHDRVLCGAGQRPQGRLRVSGGSPLRDRGAGPGLLSAGGGFPQHQQPRRPQLAARVRHFRRAGRQPRAGAAARIAHAGCHHPAHPPARAQCGPAARDAGIDRPLDAAGGDGGARPPDAARDLPGAAGQDRSHPPRHPGHPVR